ncbi:flagellar basal body rod protein FlgB [Helicobacter cetorum]|uniref:flagellar basal body rod protein FlgB n=1 Tax=Helicobacter cetorum TaxID=138563 RepID=UPI000CF108C0|nr:flagellar basal body rod protein FlgB [Helicobacter cetorum]
MDFSKAFPLAYKALDYRALRQDMIASNIANVDTPFYRPKDLDFESVLAQKKAEIFDDKSSQVLSLAYTDPKHLGFIDSDSQGASLFYRDGHLAKNDGNSVDLDIETSEMGKNSTMYLALSAALKKYRGVINYAIESSKSL